MSISRSSSSRSIVRVLSRRPSSLLLPYAPPPAPPLPGPARWSSSQADHLAEENTDTKLIPPQHTSFKEHYSLAKGKERMKGNPEEVKDRMVLLSEMLVASQDDLFESQRRKDVELRYPGLKSGQVSLMTVLVKMIDKAKAVEIGGLSAQELFQIHTFLLVNDQKNTELHIERKVGFQRSSASYAMMLKYAHQRRDATALRYIAKEGLSWKHYQSRGLPLRPNKKPRYVHPRMAAAEDLSRLARNLFVSLRVKHKQEASRGTETFLPGKKLPSSELKVMRGEDAIALSSLLQYRLGTFKLAKDENNETYLKLSRPSQLSSYPLTHQSRRIRWINRMTERGLFEEATAKDGIRTGRLLPKPDRKVIAAQPTIVKRVQEGDVADMIDILSSSSKSIQQSGQIQKLRDAYEKWQSELMTRLKSRKNVARVLKQFHLKPSTATEEEVAAITQVVPTWLVLSSLRMQVYVGESNTAEKIVSLYLKSLQAVHGNRPLSEVIPAQSNRVHAITDPFTPPQGPSLLNGMLRAHAVGGASDCFENMLFTFERWAIGGHKLYSSVLQQRRTEDPKQDAFTCLSPDDKTLSILLDSLRNRRKRISIGIRLVEEVWKRWAIIGFGEERRCEPFEKHQVLCLSLRHFSTLLSWAVVDERHEKVERVLAMEKKWRDSFSEEGDRLYVASPEERMSWEKAKRKAEKVKVKVKLK